MQTLHLGSQSKSRQKLLDLACIPYRVIQHTSDECGVDASGSFHEYVLAIAQHKMDHLVLPDAPSERQPLFFLTADTLMRTAKSKQILGKPIDLAEAKSMLAMLCKEPIDLATACCLEQKKWNGTHWVTTIKEQWITPAILEFCVEEDEVDAYLEKTPNVLEACGGGKIEDFGLNFLKRIDGSFSTILGLPLYQLRIRLKKIGFFN